MLTATGDRKPGKMMLVGLDHSQILQRRFKSAGYEVVTVADILSAIEHARRQPLDTAVLVSMGSLVNVADTVFNLRDLNRSMEIIILVNRLGPRPGRLLRPLLEHPIEGTRVLTRRQLQRELTASLARQYRSTPR